MTIPWTVSLGIDEKGDEVMMKLIKGPAFLIKWLDAFILRIPASLVIVAAICALMGLNEQTMPNLSDAEAVFLLGTIVVFALIYGFLYVAVTSVYPRKKSSAAQAAKYILAVLILGSYVNKAVETGNGIIDHLAYITTAGRFVLLWVVYMIASDIVKKKLSPKPKKRRTGKEDPTYITFCQILAAGSAVSNMESAVYKKQRAIHDKRIDELLKDTAKKKSNPHKRQGGKKND